MKSKSYLFIAILFILVQTIHAQDKRVFIHTDSLTSKIHWKCDVHRGFFKIRYGGFLLVNDSIRLGAFVIRTGSFTDMDIDKKKYGTAHTIFTNTIKNEFLEVEKYPYAYFETRSIQLVRPDLYSITGDLTLHGIKKEIRITAHIYKKSEKWIFKSEKFHIDRTEWGILRLSKKNPVPDDQNGWTVSDQVEMQIYMELYE